MKNAFGLPAIGSQRIEKGCGEPVAHTIQNGGMKVLKRIRQIKNPVKFAPEIYWQFRRFKCADQIMVQVWPDATYCPAKILLYGVLRVKRRRAIDQGFAEFGVGFGGQRAGWRNTAQIDTSGDIGICQNGS